MFTATNKNILTSNFFLSLQAGKACCILLNIIHAFFPRFFGRDGVNFDSKFIHIQYIA